MDYASLVCWISSAFHCMLCAGQQCRCLSSVGQLGWTVCQKHGGLCGGASLMKCLAVRFKLCDKS